MKYTVLLPSIFFLGACVVTQTGNPSLRPDAGPDGSLPDLNLGDVEVRPSLFGAPGTELGFIINEQLQGSTLRVTPLSSEAAPTDVTLSAGEVTATVPAFDGEWIRLQLITTSGRQQPIDALIESDALQQRESLPACVNIVRSLDLRQQSDLRIENGCMDTITINASIRTSDALAITPRTTRIEPGNTTDVLIEPPTPTAPYENVILIDIQHVGTNSRQATTIFVD